VSEARASARAIIANRPSLTVGLLTRNLANGKSCLKIAGRKALVIGAARSGIASARFLAQRGATVALNDRKPLSEWSPAALALKTEGVGLVEGDRRRGCWIKSIWW